MHLELSLWHTEDKLAKSLIPAFPVTREADTSYLRLNARNLLVHKMGEQVFHKGGCHCGNVKFSIMHSPDLKDMSECNCSICAMKGNISVLTNPSSHEPC